MEIKTADRHLQKPNCSYNQNRWRAAGSPGEWSLCMWRGPLGFHRAERNVADGDSICRSVPLWSQRVGGWDEDLPSEALPSEGEGGGASQPAGVSVHLWLLGHPFILPTEK